MTSAGLSEACAAPRTHRTASQRTGALARAAPGVRLKEGSP